ncbi:unnamed protein product, partial [marine sediment metagenome]
QQYHQGFRQIVLHKMDTISKLLNGITGNEKGKLLLNSISEKGFNELPRVNRINRLMILLRCAAKYPLFHFRHIPSFFYYRLKYFFSLRGEFISFSGPDGSGKTTILELALNDLKKAFRMGE